MDIHILSHRHVRKGVLAPESMWSSVLLEWSLKGYFENFRGARDDTELASSPALSVKPQQGAVSGGTSSFYGPNLTSVL